MAYTALAAPFVLHRTKIGKGVMKKIGINCERGVNFFVDNHLSFFDWKIRDECSAPLEISQTVFPTLAMVQRCLLRLFQL
jgi:hypothetical protein